MHGVLLLLDKGFSSVILEFISFDIFLFVSYVVLLYGMHFGLKAVWVQAMINLSFKWDSYRDTNSLFHVLVNDGAGK